MKNSNSKTFLGKVDEATNADEYNELLQTILEFETMQEEKNAAQTIGISANLELPTSKVSLPISTGTIIEHTLPEAHTEWPSSINNVGRKPHKQEDMSKTTNEDASKTTKKDTSETTKEYESKTKKEDSFEYFGLYVSSVLRSLPQQRALKLQQQFTTALLEAQTSAKFPSIDNSYHQHSHQNTTDNQPSKSSSRDDSWIRDV